MRKLLLFVVLSVFSLGLTEEAKADPLVSSYYGPGLQGNLTCNGEIFNMFDLTAASLIYPPGTVLEVSYKGRTAIVRVNDCGPHVGGRHLDLSLGAALFLGLTPAGVDVVEVRKI